MKQILILAIIIFMSITANSRFVNYRQLLVFGNEANKQLVTKQLHLLDSAKEGLNERDVRVINVSAASELNKKYKVKPNSFIIILVGKDGGEKHRSSTVLPVNQLFAIIDAMPMRQIEMKKKQ